MKTACGLLAALALALAACGGEETPAPTATPTATATAAPTASRETGLDALAGTHVEAAAERRPRGWGPVRGTGWPTPAPVRVSGVGWSQPEIPLRGGFNECRVEV